MSKGFEDNDLFHKQLDLNEYMKNKQEKSSQQLNHMDIKQNTTFDLEGIFNFENPNIIKKQVRSSLYNKTDTNTHGDIFNRTLNLKRKEHGNSIFGDVVMQHDEVNRETDSENMLKIKDRFLPLANVSKIMKQGVPDAAKIAKDAKSAVQHSASEFIAIVTCKAKDLAIKDSRKVVTGEDLIHAMEELDLSFFSDITIKFFNQYKKTTNTYASMYFDQNGKY